MNLEHKKAQKDAALTRDLEDDNELYIARLQKRIFKNMIDVNNTDESAFLGKSMTIGGSVNSKKFEAKKTRALDSKLLEDVQDKELITLFEDRVKNLDRGLDEQQYLERKEILVYGLSPESFKQR